VEVLEPCPTMYGKFNKLGSAPEMIQQIRDEVIPVKRWDADCGKLPIGVLRNVEMMEYTEAYAEVIRKAGGSDGN